ncbi:MAG TPA: hypothetical protein PKC59_03410 [Burkholderiaceae bacterium]|nr:hypothetical protein [Burkholderiaceae bacterium]HMY98823.1 hypothetical protein [Burkholderiaceae bacterium]HNB42698.1 hypothetical protein [Burkholderiaceae bacterium]HNG77910.1 hypothetical protein [Burkholderiaceae bacterium]
MASFLPRLATRIVFTLAAGLFLISLVFAGAVLSLIWFVWSLLNGRRPTWRGIDLRAAQSWRRPDRRTPPWGGFAAAPVRADVVEGQAREIRSGEALPRRD